MGKAARKTEPISARVAEEASKTLSENKVAKKTGAGEGEGATKTKPKPKPRKRRISRDSPHFLKHAFPRAHENIKKWSRETDPAKFISSARMSNLSRQKLQAIQELNGDGTKMKISKKFLQHMSKYFIAKVLNAARVGVMFSRQSKRHMLMGRDVLDAIGALGDTSIDSSITLN